MAKVIGIAGKMGVGKTTLTTKLISALKSKGYKVRYIKFADALYQMQDAVYNISGLTMKGEKDRELLQWLGTEWGRKKDKDIWVNAWQKSVEKCLSKSDNHTIIITDDMRFLNEEAKVKSLGGFTIKVDGPQRGDNVSSTTHSSEKDVDKMKPEYTFHNGREILELELNIDYALLPSIEAFFNKKQEELHG